MRTSREARKKIKELGCATRALACSTSRNSPMLPKFLELIVVRLSKVLTNHGSLALPKPKLFRCTISPFLLGSPTLLRMLQVSRGYLTHPKSTCQWGFYNTFQVFSKDSIFSMFPNRTCGSLRLHKALKQSSGSVTLLNFG